MFKNILSENKAASVGKTMRPLQPFLENLKDVCPPTLIISAHSQSSTSMFLNHAVIALGKQTYSNREAVSETLAALTPPPQKNMVPDNIKTTNIFDKKLLNFNFTNNFPFKLIYDQIMTKRPEKSFDIFDHFLPLRITSPLPFQRGTFLKEIQAFLYIIAKNIKCSWRNLRTFLYAKK